MEYQDPNQIVSKSSFKPKGTVVEDKLFDPQNMFYLFVLFLIHACAQCQTFLLVYIRDGEDPFKNFQKELDFNDTQFGILTGTVFTLTNSLSCIFMGYQVDKYNRKKLLIYCSLVWNSICILQSYVQTYNQMVVIRMGFAAVSSIHVPACISLINDYFRHEDRSKANSVFVTAVSIGVGIANLTSIINKKIGWRNSSLCVSCTGLFVTFLIILIKEPRRQCERGNQMILEEKFRTFRRRSKSVILTQGSVASSNHKRRLSYQEIQLRITQDVIIDHNNRLSNNIAKNNEAVVSPSPNHSESDSQSSSHQSNDRFDTGSIHVGTKLNSQQENLLASARFPDNGGSQKKQFSQDEIKMLAQMERFNSRRGSLSQFTKENIVKELGCVESQQRTFVEQSPRPQRETNLTAKMTNRWKSSFKINLKFWQKVEILMGNKAYIYLLIASFFRFSAGYALGIWSKSYFSNVYPEHQDDFAVAYFFILIFGSVPSELIGGYIGDTYEQDYPRVKGYLSAAGAFIGSIFIVFTFLIKSSFWMQIAAYYFEYLFAEVFFGPTYAQMNKIVQSQAQGLAVAIFMLVGATAGSLINYLLGYLGDHYVTDENPQIQGQILGSAVLISYILCIPFFCLNAREYAKLLQFQKLITSYVHTVSN